MHLDFIPEKSIDWIETDGFFAFFDENSLPVLLMLISLTGFYTLDVILVKIFFDPIDAGYYAAVSLFG